MPTTAARRHLALVHPAPRPAMSRDEALRRVRSARRHVDGRPARPDARRAERFTYLKRMYD